MKDTFMVVTGDAYPEGNAGAVRTHAFAKILSESGYSPFIIGMGSSTSFQKREYDGILFASLCAERPVFKIREQGFIRT